MMLSRSSRYRNCGLFATDADGRPTFPGLRPRDIVTLPPVLEHAITAWDRPDLLAVHYYNDPERWWQLLDANPEELFAGDLSAPETARVGTFLLVPRDTGR
jgi:hypothetical protein